MAQRYKASEMNRDRAGWAEQAMDTFARTTGMRSAMNDEDDSTIIGDLLGDIMHYCKQNKVDFEQCLTTGRIHFDYEFTGKE